MPDLWEGWRKAAGTIGAILRCTTESRFWRGYRPDCSCGPSLSDPLPKKIPLLAFPGFMAKGYRRMPISNADATWILECL